MGWVRGVSQVVLVTVVALSRRGYELSDERPRVTPVAGCGQMGRHQGEAGPIVHLDLPGGSPRILLMAGGAIGAQLTKVKVLVASDAPLGVEDGDGPPIVVTTETLRPGVRSIEGNTRFDLVVEREVFGQNVPLVAHVAQAAIRGERIVRQDWPQPGPPPVQLTHTRSRAHARHDQIRQGGDEQ